MNEEGIGGYFDLELFKGEHYHKDAIRLNTARNCFEYILRVRKYKKVYIPYYTCDVLLEPLLKLEVSFEFYHINEQLEPIKDIELKAGEAFLYTNYFGLKQNTVKRLSSIYNERLIIDNAQAFYAKPINGIDTFYSARKFFGVPDGAYLYTNKTLDITDQDVSYHRMNHLIKRIDVGAEEGYKDFQNNEISLIGQPIRKMSKLTEALLSSIDYSKAKEQRQSNYMFLNQKLSGGNNFQFSLDKNEVPMSYLYYSEDLALKSRLIDNKIYVPTYWPNVLNWLKPRSIESELVNKLICLPLDQRYDKNEMEKIINIINLAHNE